MKTVQDRVFAFLLAALLLPGGLRAQSGRLTVASTVRDAQGQPIANAEVFSGSAYAVTDAEGKFRIRTDSDMRIIVEAEGYETASVRVADALNMETFELVRSPFLYGEDDIVEMAFGRRFEGDIVGAHSKVNARKVMDYDFSTWGNNVMAGRTLGMLGSNNIRGLGIGEDVAAETGTGAMYGNALYIVDGLPRDIQSLRLSEIESITVLKDVNTSILYGSAALNGVVLVTTKRGTAHKNLVEFNANYGVASPLEIPKYLNSADYMVYNNLAYTNDGQEPLWSEQTIENYRNGNKYRYPDVDYYSNEYLRKFRNYFDLNAELGGGNEVAKYYANLGWYSSGGLLDFGNAGNARNNIFNVRGNVDLKVNDWITTAIDGVALFGINRSGRGNYWSSAASLRPYLFTPLIPFDLIDPDDPLLKARKNDVDGKFLIGGNSSNTTTPFGNSYAGGVYEGIFRKFSFNNRINFDLGAITEGLSFHTNLSFDYYMAYPQTTYNQYSVYEPVWSDTEDKIVSLKQHGTDDRPGSQNVGTTTFRRRMGFYGMLNYDRILAGKHHLVGKLIAFGSQYKQTNDFQGVKQTHLGLQLNYVYDRRFMADFSSNYANSVKLPKGTRRGFSPSLGLAWMVSNEAFMRDVPFVDYLKLRVSGGILKSDIPVNGFFWYDSRYGNSGSLNWYEGNRGRSGVVSSWGTNDNLGFGDRRELTFGFDGLFFDKLLGLEANAFFERYANKVVRPTTTFPSFYWPFVPYQNFEQDSYKGVEVGLKFNKQFGDFGFMLGANLLYVTSNRDKVDEVWDNDYQFRQGKPVDATFGLEALGLFKDQQDIDNSPVQSFGAVQPGDIKYKDQNGDNVIDSNDEVYLRRWQAPFSGGLELKLSYKNLTLYALGEGRMGSDTFREGNYYWVDGNDKYSEVVLGSWTPETAATATFPRLSAAADNNNFRRSTYWMYNNDYFQIRKVQLTYTFPVRIAKALYMKNMRVFLDCSGPIQFAPNRKLRELRIGNEPYTRSFSIGLKTVF